MTALCYTIDVAGLDLLLKNLAAADFQPVGPIVADGAIVYEPVSSTRDLPAGYEDEQSGGHYRLRKADENGPFAKALFRTVVGPQSWKRYLYPANQKLWSARRNERNWEMVTENTETPYFALIGVRACELAAIEIHDRVLSQGDYSDQGYGKRRDNAFIIAVNCTRAADTCFCASMDTGPKVKGGFDLALTELASDGHHRFLVEIGSDRGATLLDGLAASEATPDDFAAAAGLIGATTHSMKKRMPEGAREILRDNPEHPQWRDVASRCLNCANCTMVCPTCFCTTTEDTTSLDGETAERWRRWDSCFTVDFSHIHGGPIRREATSRYRHWITHKLSTWHDQFGVSGCTGCGRCITWCPVGIDITEEVAAIKAAPQHNGDQR